METAVVKKNNFSEIINKTLRVLEGGGLVIFPSDTVYGALVDATNEKAVKKLIAFKARPPGKAISVFVSGFKMIEDMAEMTEGQLKAIGEILPGPFTVILKSKHKIARLLESEKGTIGIRYPIFEMIESLVKKFGKPITATSANLSGYPPHYSVNSLLNRLPEEKKRLIALIVDANKLPRNKPSTVIDLTQPRIKVLRQGEIVFKDKKTYLSKTPEQTKKIARYLFNKLLTKVENKPLIVIIEGDLGVGKTVFVKGIGEMFGIDGIISPSFVIYYEYPVCGSLISELVHIDLYNIEDREEFKYLGIERYLKPGNLLCFEWGEKAGEIFDQLKDKGKIVYVKMKYVNENERLIEVKS